MITWLFIYYTGSYNEYLKFSPIVHQPGQLVTKMGFKICPSQTRDMWDVLLKKFNQDCGIALIYY